MGRANEGFEVVRGTIISVDGVDVLCPIAMVTAIGVYNNRVIVVSCGCLITIF